LVKIARIGLSFHFHKKIAMFSETFTFFYCMVEKHSKFACVMRFRALLTVGAMLSCGLVQMYAGNGPSKPVIDPKEEISAIQYDIVKGSWMLRTDFDKNRDFAELLLDAYKKMEPFRSALPKITDWRPAAEAYHKAFIELKEQLQGEWGRIFGYGPSRFPWNGNSDGATDLWREDDLRRDMPVNLFLWAKGHICSEVVTCYYYLGGGVRTPNDNKAYVPNSPLFSAQKVIDKGKDAYKVFVLKFFNAKKLNECAEYLQKFFCEPVAKLLQRVAPTLEEATDKADLLRLLQLYADYYSLDAIYNHSQEDFVETTRRMVCLMVKCYSNYIRWKPEDQEWLCSLLNNLEANYYKTENLHTYCIQSHDLWCGFWHNFSCNGSERDIQDDGLDKVGAPSFPRKIYDKLIIYAGKRWFLKLEVFCIMKRHGVSYGTPIVVPYYKTFDEVLHMVKDKDAVLKRVDDIGKEWFQRRVRK